MPSLISNTFNDSLAKLTGDEQKATKTKVSAITGTVAPPKTPCLTNTKRPAITTRQPKANS